MKCESCNINNFEVEELVDDGQKPYRLCSLCLDRLLNKALRPLEFFNLTAIHGHGSYLHDDFYNYETGEATQPDIEVLETDKFPFPEFEQIKHKLTKTNLQKSQNYHCTPFFQATQGQLLLVSISTI